MDFLNNNADTQGHANWHADRLGRFTASRYPDLMKNGGLEYSLDGKKFHALPDFDEDKKTIDDAIVYAFGANDLGFTVVNERKKDWLTHEKWGEDKYNPLVKTGFADFVKRVYETFGHSRKSMGETAKGYVLQVAYEIITGVPQGFDGNHATDWGHENEPLAIAKYEEVTGRKVTAVGFCAHPINSRAGGSPDGLVGGDGMVEIKCPYNGLNHAKNVLTDAFVIDYEWQVQGNLWVTGRKWCDLISYDPRMEGLGKGIYIMRIERDSDKIAQLEARIAEASELLDEYLERLGYVEEESNIF